MLEDSLDLWWTLVQTAPASTPDLLSLFPAALELLDYDTENLRKILKIIDSYIMLDPQSTLQPQYALVLFEKLGSKILYIREQAGSYVAHTLDLTFKSVPLQLYGEVLIQSKLMSNILNVLIQDKVRGTNDCL